MLSLVTPGVRDLDVERGVLATPGKRLDMVEMESPTTNPTPADVASATIAIVDFQSVDPLHDGGVGQPCSIDRGALKHSLGILSPIAEIVGGYLLWMSSTISAEATVGLQAIRGSAASGSDGLLVAVVLGEGTSGIAGPALGRVTTCSDGLFVGKVVRACLREPSRTFPRVTATILDALPVSMTGIVSAVLCAPLLNITRHVRPPG